MDRRIRSVELKKSVFTKAGLSPSVDDEVDPTLPEGTIYAGDAPNAWHRITGAYYYPARIIGSGDRAEIFLAASDSGLGAERGGVISMSRLQSSVGGVTINTTDSDPEYYTVRAYGTPNWALTTSNTRQSKQVNTTQVYFPLADTGSGVGHTYLFSPASDTTYSFPPFTLRYELKFRALVSKHSATTATATLTFSSGHHYQVDDVIEVMDLPSGYRGIDGIFKVKAITSTTLTYDFDTPLTAAITEANASAGVYVYSVAQEYVRDGATYINSSDGTVYYWDGLRYTLSAPPGLTNDGNAPSPPTDLTLTTSGYSLADGSPRSRVDLSWTAPTTSAGGGGLDDLAGYRIFISETGYSNWTQKITYEKAVTAQTITNLDQNKEYYFRVIAFDSFGLDSEGLDDSVITGTGALSVTTPSAPVIPAVRFAVATIKWDGKDSAGAVVSSKLLDHLEVHASTTSGFTPLPGSATLVGKIFSASDFASVSDLTYNLTYYFKFIAKDKAGNFTSASAQTSAVIRPLVDADLIAAELNSPLSVWPFAAGAVTPGSLASGAINASNLFGSGVIVQAAIAANAIGADQIATNAITAGKIEANAVTTAKLDALAVTAAKIATNAIEADKINAGAITAVKIAAEAVTAGKIEAGSITGDRVNATTSINFSSGLSSATIGTGVIAGQGGYATGMSVTASGATGDFGTYNDGNGVQVLHRATGNGLFLYNGGISLVSTYSSGSIGIQNVNSTGGVYVDAGGGNLQLTGGLFAYVSTPGEFYVSYNNLLAQAVIRGTTGTAPKLIVGNNSAGSTTNQTLDVHGRIRATGTITASTSISSKRYKTDIRIFNVPESLFEIEPKIFKYDNEKKYASWKDGNPSSEKYSEDTLGAIAEDFIEAGLGYLVDYNEEGLPESLDYSRIAVLLIPAIKELRDEIKALKLGMNK
jgi:hypothetical protein